MSFPKNFKRASIASVAMLAMVASGVGFGLTSASATDHPQPQLTASNFIVVVGDCNDGLRTLQFSFDFTGGPDSWSIDRDPVDNGPNVANGSVTTATGSVSGTIAGQPAGEFMYALYGSRGGLPTAQATVTVDACPITPSPVECQSDANGLTGSAVVVGDTVVYKASLPKKACADTWVANGDTYRVADTYDGSGNFNASSTPQYFFPGTRVDLVIKKGEKNVTEVRKLPVTCWWVQVDTYTGKKIDIVGPGGHGGQFLGGGFKKLSSTKCDQPPSDTKVTPTAPTSVDKCGTKDDTYTVPSMNGVDYLVGNEVVAAGTYSGTGSVTIVAKAKAGFMLNGTSTWTFGFTNVACEQPPVVVINPSGKVTVDCKGSGTATFDNSKSTTQVGFELVVNGNATLYSVSAGAVKQQSFSGAKSGSKVVVQDGEANELSSVVVAKCAIKPPTTVVVVPRPTTNLPVPTKVQTDGGELMSSETSGSGVLPFIVGFGFLIVGGLTLKLRRREARN